MVSTAFISYPDKTDDGNQRKKKAKRVVHSRLAFSYIKKYYQIPMASFIAAIVSSAFATASA